MYDMSEQVKRERCRMCTWVFFACFVLSVALIVGGFFVPPMGIIDGSVLTAVGELIIFPTLAFGMRAVELGYELNFSHGQTSMAISRDEHDDKGKEGGDE